MTEPLANLKAALSGRYDILEELGAGGMATVYLAHDVRHDRKVALKVLRPDLAATLGPQRFLNEIRIAANLTHPHVLPVHDSGEADGFLFYVMPYIKGESLRDKIAREGELPIPEAARILRDVVDALAAAHASGVVHRDIKPDNVLLSGRHALVMDFGVAKAVSEATGREQLTTVGVALGTPHYMAPEQAAADPHIDHRADIYAVGALAYELLTGRPPFAGVTTQQILAAHVTETPDPVSKRRPSVPPPLEQLVMKCLQKKAADRWQQAEELLPLLESVATPSGGVTPTTTRPVEATPALTAGRALAQLSWPRALPILLGFLTASALALAGVRVLITQLGLPGWFLAAGAALLLIGLPIVLTTAAVQGAAPDGTPTDPRGRPWLAPKRWFTWHRAILGGVLAFAALTALGLGLVWQRNRGHVLEPDVVAIVPFRVVGSELELWREGLMDLLSTALDGTGRLRASDPRAVLGQWKRTVGEPGTMPGPEQAAEVAKALSAGLLIQGSVVMTGPGEVRVTADLYNTKWLRKEGSVVVDGQEDDMAGLVDRMSVDLLKSIWRAEEIPEIRVSSVTTGSVPALRAYLEGEQAFRESQFVRAREAFTRALEIDSTFAIAAHRLSISYGWSAGSFAEEHLRYAALAARHTAGLPARDSLLILGHRLVDFDGDLSVLPIYQRLTASFPEDFEAWYGLAEAYYHLGPQAGYSPAEIIEATGHAYALDSTLAPVLIHAVQAAHQLDDSALVRTWTVRYLAVDSLSPLAVAFDLAAALRFGSAADSQAAALALDTVGGDVLDQMGGGTLAGPASLPFFEQVNRARFDPRFSDRDRAFSQMDMGQAYMRHGQIGAWLRSRREAERLLGRDLGLFDPAMGRLAGIVDDATWAAFEPAARQRPYPLNLLVLALLQGREDGYRGLEDGIGRLERQADSLVGAGDSVGARTARGLALAYRGHVASARDSVETAIDRLRQGLTLISAHAGPPTRDLHRFALAELIERQGEEIEALRIYTSLSWSPWLQALGYLRAAQLHERRRETPQALASYGRFITLWRDADEHLQPQVAQARAAMRRLAGEATE